MKLEFLFLFAFVTTIYSKALDEIAGLKLEEHAEEKVREKRKYEPIRLENLEKIGAVEKDIGKTVEPESQVENKRTLELISPKDLDIPLNAPTANEFPAGHRVKKQSQQSPNNVCIKMRDCGKTACGPLVSGFGPVTGDLRSMMQGKNIPEMNRNVLDEVDLPPNGMMNGMMPPMDYRNAQSKTIDLFGYNPLALQGYGSGVSTSSSSSSNAANANSYGNSGNYGGGNYGGSLGYGQANGGAHSFYKPPEPIPAPINYGYQHQIHPLHALLFQHPGLSSPGLSPHRLDLSRLQDLLYTPPEIRQPVYLPQPAYISHSYDSPLICQPLKNKKYQDYAQDKIDKVDTQIDDKVDEKALAAANATEETENAKNVDSSEYYYEGKSIQEHLRRIDEIKQQISQLNRAAQRIVDQQEKLAEMQQRHMYRNAPPQYQRANNEYEERNIPPYYGGGMGGSYYPGGYYSGFRSNGQSATSFPNSQEDTEFFINLMQQLKKMGMLSNSFQQSIIAPVDDKTGQKDSQDDKNTKDKEENRQSENLGSDLIYGDKQKQQGTKSERNKSKQQS